MPCPRNESWNTCAVPWKPELMLPGRFWIVGAVFVISAIVSFARKGRRAFYALPRESQDVRGELPVESFRAPAKSE